MNKLILTFGFALIANFVSAQSNSNTSNLLFFSVAAVCAVLVIWAMFGLASNLMKIEAMKNGIDPESTDMGIFPTLADFISPKRPKYATGGSFHHFTKGHDIKLAGKPASKVESQHATRYAIKPTDFHGMSPIPKVEPEIGQDVKAGDVLFYDKKRPEIKYCAPVSGEIVEVKRGEKRSIAEVIILADKEVSYKKVQAPDNAADRSTLVAFMAENGLWAMINERPFDVVPDLDSIPSNIFISTFDTAPLAPDNNLIVKGKEAAFQKGLDVLAKLTTGKVHLGLDGRGTAPSTAFSGAQGAEKHWFAGPHPAGNVGVHIHHVSPIKGLDKVWTLSVQNVITIGQMFLTGEFRAERVVALTGAELSDPKYVQTYQGASVSDLLKGNIIGDNNRIISGDVLSGQQINENGFISFNADQVTVVKEGNDYELFGWLLPLAPRPSVSGTIPSYGGADTEFEANTNTHGERRAFVVSGQYEDLLPMDIYPQHLMKAIITGNIERMEGLGITELTEEDVALCEFACTSKNPLQSMLRDGLNNLKEQL
jgi:Na+-transporting NADH:ubiquinone oxidoreductase subunit A